MTIMDHFHFNYHPHHHDDDEVGEEPQPYDDEEEEPFHCYFWKKYKFWTCGALLLLVLGIPVFVAGGRYSHPVQEPICGCEPDKNYCCPMVFNNPNSGAATKCHKNQCYCYGRNPFTDVRTGGYFCMPLEESKSFEINIIEEPCPLMLLVGFLSLLCGVLALTGICWSIPTEQRRYEAMEIQKEMALLQSRLRIASAAMRKAPRHDRTKAKTSADNSDKPEYQKLCQVEIV